MKLPKRYELILLVIVAGIIFSLVNFYAEKKNEKEVASVNAGNALRVKNSVPIIEDNWIREGLEHKREKWHDGVPGIDTDQPTHLYKEITYESESRREERDAFHYEMSDSVQYRLIIHNEFDDKGQSPERTRNELIIYEPAKFPPSHSVSISTMVADSVLAAWRIK